jgi:hypothetical protein
MYGGTIFLTSFNYQVVDGEAQGARPDGKPTGQKLPVKILVVRELSNPMTIQIMFSPEELEQFVSVVSGSKIIRARELPPFTFVPPGGTAQKL